MKWPQSTRKTLIGIFVVAVLPLWFGQAWLIGLFNASKEYPINNIKPSFEQSTKVDLGWVSYCLGKNWSGKFALQKVNSPSSSSETIRFRNRPQHIVVDLSRQNEFTNIKAYKLNGNSLLEGHRNALESCLQKQVL